MLPIWGDCVSPTHTHTYTGQCEHNAEVVFLGTARGKPNCSCLLKALLKDDTTGDVMNVLWSVDQQLAVPFGRATFCIVFVLYLYYVFLLHFPKHFATEETSFYSRVCCSSVLKTSVAASMQGKTAAKTSVVWMQGKEEDYGHM